MSFHLKILRLTMHLELISLSKGQAGRPNQRQYKTSTNPKKWCTKLYVLCLTKARFRQLYLPETVVSPMKDFVTKLTMY